MPVRVCMHAGERVWSGGWGHSCAENLFSNDNCGSVVKQLCLSPRVKINTFSLLVLRFAQDNSPVACGAPHVASLRCRRVKRNTIPPRMPTSKVCPAQIRDLPCFQSALGKCPISHRSLRESNFTLSTF